MKYLLLCLLLVFCLRQYLLRPWSISYRTIKFCVYTAIRIGRIPYHILYMLSFFCFGLVLSFWHIYQWYYRKRHGWYSTVKFRKEILTVNIGVTHGYFIFLYQSTDLLTIPDSKVLVAKMGSTWVLPAPGGPREPWCQEPVAPFINMV